MVENCAIRFSFQANLSTSTMHFDIIILIYPCQRKIAPESKTGVYLPPLCNGHFPLLLGLLMWRGSTVHVDLDLECQLIL